MKLLLFRHQLSAEQSVQLDRAVETFHEAQDQIVLVDAGERDLPTYRGRVDFDRDVAPSTERARLEITATGRRLVDHWFSHTRNGCSVMTLEDWQIAFLEERQDEPGPTRSVPDSGTRRVPSAVACPDHVLAVGAGPRFGLLAHGYDGMHRRPMCR
jgi:hypothetical protein